MTQPIKEIYAILGLTPDGEVPEDYIFSETSWIANQEKDVQSSSEDWRTTLPKNLREYLSIKTFQMCFPTQNPALHDDQKNFESLMKYSKTMESRVYNNTNSKEHYLGDLVYDIVQNQKSVDATGVIRIKVQFQITLGEYLSMQKNSQVTDDLDKWACAMNCRICTNQVDKLELYFRKIKKQRLEEIVNYKVYGCTALFSACLYGHDDLVKRLVKSCNADTEKTGIYIENHRHYMMNPLWFTMLQDKMNIVEFLIKNGANVNSTGPLEYSPIKYACSTRNVDLLKLLIDKGGDILRKNDQGQTYLMEFMNKTEISDVLLEHGIDVGAQDNENNTALHYAVENLATGTVKKLIKKGIDINCTSDKGITPVYLACCKGNMGLLKYLHKNGGNINHRLHDGKTLLMLFVGNPEVCQYLMSNSVDIEDKDNDGKTALYYCIDQSEFETLKLLIQQGAKVDDPDHCGVAIFLMAALKGDERSVKYMLENVDIPMALKISSYELLAADAILKSNFNKAYDFWTASLNLRNDCSQPCNTKTVLHEAFYPYEEPKSAGDILKLENDEDSIAVSALIQARVLGPYHPALIDTLRNINSFLSFTTFNNHKFFVKAYIYLTNLRVKNNMSFNDQFSRDLSYFVRCLTWMNRTDVDLSIVKDFIDCLVRNLVGGIKDLGIDKSEDLRCLLEAVSVMIYYLFEWNEVKALTEEVNVRELLIEVIKVVPRSFAGKYMLMDLLTEIYEICIESREELSTSTLYDFILILIENNIPVNQITHGDTPMHQLLENVTCFDIDDYAKLNGIIELLIDKGRYHMDISGCDGHTLIELLKERGYPVCEVGNRSLQCLAAKVISENAIPYIDVIPVQLHSFIEMHN